MSKQKTEDLDSKHHFDRRPLLSNTQTVSHTNEKFILDFKGAYPQFSSGSGEAALIVNHQAIQMDPKAAKNFLQILEDNIEQYEEKHGEIELPEEPEEDIEETEESASSAKPHYMG